MIALILICADRAIAATPAPDPAAFRSAMERELIAANPILAKKRIEEIRKKAAAQEKMERDAREAKLRAAVAAYLDAELLANNPQAVIAAQRKEIDALRAESEKLSKALADIAAARERESKAAQEAAAALAKKLEELSKKIDDQAKASEEKQKALADASEKLKGELEDARKEGRDQSRRLRRASDRLLERAMRDFEAQSFDGIEFVNIPAGEFVMGASDAQIDDLKKRGLWSKLNLSETPARKVRITKPLLIGRMEITQKQWTDVMGKNPSAFQDGERPVESISWDEANDFLEKLGKKTGAKYRLPTEAEWEYCCRAGDAGQFGAAKGGAPITFDSLNDFAWTAANTKNKTEPSGKKAPNAWGLVDMNGNVWEWCADWFDPKFYERAPEADPVCSDKLTERSFRGGSWALDPEASRSAFRGGNLPGYKSQYVGLRAVREAAPD